ncbi:hypothetical protein [Halorubrum ezzemoulense]|uniref:hypothetical protein n=1 Tax=Halorubrum ezzemoulense TaxID=337243 RepID=UPI00117B326F|nr:hypothetical protein [Halorubrum ezzemoulense]
MTDEFESADAMVKITYFEPDRITEELEDGQYDTALILTATTAESIFRDKLIRYFEIPHDSFDEVCGGKTLGWYFSKCCEKGIIDEKYRESFDRLVSKRANLVHDLGYLDELRENHTERKEVRNIIQDCCDWFDSYRRDT